jgi:hypothetical protein
VNDSKSLFNSGIAIVVFPFLNDLELKIQTTTAVFSGNLDLMLILKYHPIIASLSTVKSGL